MKHGKWLIFGIVATFFAWRMIVVNVSQHLASKGSPAALVWGPHLPQVMFSEATVIAKSDTSRALEVAKDAIFYNPVSGRGFLKLSELLESQGNVALAKNAAKMAHFLAPHDDDVQLALGAFWLRRGLFVQALSHWNAALDSNGAMSKTLFPVMLQIVNVPENRLAAADALSSAAKWWESFFMYALKNTTQEDTLKALYLARSNNISYDLRRAYIDHLLEVGYYTDAYFLWLNGLQAGQLSALGNVNDGGFEQVLDDVGFGWRPKLTKGFMLAVEPTYGSGGKNALHIAFQQRLSSRDLVNQFLMLDAGKYRFAGRSRLENLEVGKGLRWSVSCVDKDGRTQLASTEHFIGSDGWNKFEAEFVVPSAKCEVQVLLLQLNAGNDFDDTPFSGSAWFDDFEILKLDQ